MGHRLGALFASGILALIFVGCGISLGAGPDETEVLKRLTVEGDFVAGGSLSLTLDYEQPYPVAVNVDCDLFAAERKTRAIATPTPAEALPGEQMRPNKVQDILFETLPANPEEGPVVEVTPVSGTARRSFSAPELAGRYVVKCFTPEDDNNAIRRRITIAPAPAPTETATP